MVRQGWIWDPEVDLGVVSTEGRVKGDELAKPEAERVR